MNYEFLAEARDEFGEAALFYESQEAGLGVRFRDEVAHDHRHPNYWKDRMKNT